MFCVTRKAAGSSGKKGAVGENQFGGFRRLPSISHVRVAKALHPSSWRVAHTLSPSCGDQSIANTSRLYRRIIGAHSGLYMVTKACMILQEVFFRDTGQVKYQVTTGLDKDWTAMRNEVIETQDARHQDEQDNNWNGDIELDMGGGG